MSLVRNIMLVFFSNSIIQFGITCRIKSGGTQYIERQQEIKCMYKYGTKSLQFPTKSHSFLRLDASCGSLWSWLLFSLPSSLLLYRQERVPIGQHFRLNELKFVSASTMFEGMESFFFSTPV